MLKKIIFRVVFTTLAGVVFINSASGNVITIKCPDPKFDEVTVSSMPQQLLSKDDDGYGYAGNPGTNSLLEIKTKNPNLTWKGDGFLNDRPDLFKWKYIDTIKDEKDAILGYNLACAYISVYENTIIMTTEFSTSEPVILEVVPK